MQILLKYQYDNKMCWKKCLGKMKHICKLFSRVEVRVRSEKFLVSPISLYGF